MTTASETRFGKYILISKIGSGGMAEVFKAHPLRAPGKLLAIKRVLPQFSQNKELISMLVKEASVCVSLDHPNIVSTFDFGLVSGSYFLAMEYVHGKDLKSVLTKVKEQKSELPIPVAIHIAVQVLRGLDYAHHRLDNYQRPLEIVHRDVSPQNVMISYHGKIKLLDFGIAKVTAKQDPSELGVLKGKFLYMSPEQAYGKELDPRSDIYATAIMLWELLTGQPCYQAQSDLELLRLVRDANIRPPDAVNDRVPKELSAILMKAVAKKPSGRYDTAGDFADALEAFQRERYGLVSADDVSTFLRRFYAFELSELMDTISFSDLKVDSSPLDDLAPDAGNKTVSQIRAPWIQREREKYTFWIRPVTIVLVSLVALYAAQPPKLFRWFDRQCIKSVEIIQRRLGFVPDETQSATIELRKIPYRPSRYKVVYANKARQAMEDLPFENFDSVREAIEDLSQSTDPLRRLVVRPKGIPYMMVSRYRVEAVPNNNTQTLLIQDVVAQ